MILAISWPCFRPQFHEFPTISWFWKKLIIRIFFLILIFCTYFFAVLTINKKKDCVEDLKQFDHMFSFWLIKSNKKGRGEGWKQIVKSKYVVPYLRGTFYALHLPLRHEHYGALFPSMKLVAYKKAVFYISRSEYQFLTTRKH